MARRLTFHLGLQKTGTTSLQQHLQRNAVALADRLVIRVPAKGSVMRPFGWSAIQFSLDPTTEREATFREAARAVRAEIPPGTVPVLISHENLAGAMPGNRGTVAFYPMLPRIAAILDEEFSGFDVDHLIYTREMAAWKRSVWGQAVVSDGYPGTLEHFLAETADTNGWEPVIERLATAIGPGRLTVLRLEDEADPARPGRQLLAHAGLGLDEIDALTPHPARANAAPHGGALEFIRLVNGLEIPFRARSAVASLAARHHNLFAGTAPAPPPARD